jgi:hypothetical protein
VLFEADSKLFRIELGAFAGCWSLASVFIPRLVSAIEAFGPGRLKSVMIADGNVNFKMNGPLLVDCRQK